MLLWVADDTYLSSRASKLVTLLMWVREGVLYNNIIAVQLLVELYIVREIVYLYDILKTKEMPLPYI